MDFTHQSLSRRPVDARIGDRNAVAQCLARIERLAAPLQIGFDHHAGDRRVPLEHLVHAVGEYQRLADRSLASLVECTPLLEPEPGRRRNAGAARAVRLNVDKG